MTRYRTPALKEPVIILSEPMTWNAVDRVFHGPPELGGILIGNEYFGDLRVAPVTLCKSSHGVDFRTSVIVGCCRDGWPIEVRWEGA